MEAGINAERVDFLHEEERFEGKIVVEAEEIAEGRDRRTPRFFQEAAMLSSPHQQKLAGRSSV